MGSNYKDLRCTGCNGTLEYRKEKKAYECIYCGNLIRREEQYDGLYTIKNVVKQVLTDLAYGRLESAQKNVIECEKIASSYVGTVIAQICMKYYLLTTPGACQDSEVKSIYSQVLRLKEKLNEIDSNISAEEQALYESFEDGSDAFGVLLLVFDSLKAGVHFDFVKEFFDASLVYSRVLNARLLNYALKKNDTEMAGKIFANSDNIDCRSALLILLNTYADSEQKRSYMDEIFSKAELQEDDYKQFEKYLNETQDQVETKVHLYTNAVKYHKAPSIRCVLDHILSENGIENIQVERVLNAFCSKSPRDAELYELVEEMYTKHTGAVAINELQILLGSSLFIKPSVNMIWAMLSNSEWSAQERAQMLELSQQCKIDAKSNDVIMSNILLKLKEDVDTRVLLINKMTEYVKTISTMSMTEYILKSNLDGERKPEIMGLIFQLDVNMSFYRDVLSKYMASDVDSPEVKKQIVQMLGSKGLNVDSDVLVNMACEATSENFMEAVTFIQTSLNNGARLENHALSTYLEKVSPKNYHKELISILHTTCSRITDKALTNYVLYTNDAYNVKVQNSVVFAEQNGKSFGTSACSITYLNSKIQCNLFQAYVLMTKDSVEVTETIVNAMKNSGAKLNQTMRVGDAEVKFKKFVTDYKSRLSETTLMICEKNKVFSLFF